MTNADVNATLLPTDNVNTMSKSLSSLHLADAPSSMKTKKDTASSQQYTVADQAVRQLLLKLDEGAQTIANLRSILALKTAELNELLAQLDMTNQVIVNVEESTVQIENMLKEMGITDETQDRQALLLNAEASLHSAIKSANSLYAAESDAWSAQRRYVLRRPSAGTSNSGIDPEPRQPTHSKFQSKIRYKPDSKPILRKLNELLRHLELDSGKFFESIGNINDVQALQKAYVDLDIAKTISLSAKSNFKRRTILLKSARRRNILEEVKMLGAKIREGEALWKTYARNAPMLIDGQDIIATLNREDELLAKNLPVHPSRLSYDSHVRRSPSISSSSHGMKPSLSSRSNESTASSTRTTATHRPSHSRSPSIQSDISLIPPPPSQTASPRTSMLAGSHNKKLYRHSVGARPSPAKVIATNPTGPRVRTTSITAHKPSPTTIKPPTSTITKPKEHISSIPTPVSSSIQHDSTMTTVAKKSTTAKSNQQRGPGSTLRLRSVLAKRQNTLAKP
ncbi:uncharacterized protein BYT42DRAFT_546901 [Radiomyces spectabilis]|uniref:uncharacterized protein n=1 Tax=Radiomyces spectabilis TaxID=64574 RepID=UPI002220C718|nr:uncharacterized protein BYT42DRAFT_546901 [Radiomyces spectabilis]KAI8376190.1 hypothetical protein BYT42DRAFT_546901 [Radiomyces spectabilis]